MATNSGVLEQNAKYQSLDTSSSEKVVIVTGGNSGTIFNIKRFYLTITFEEITCMYKITLINVVIVKFSIKGTTQSRI